MTDVFISYSRKDVEFARQLTASLEEHGADVWFDQADIHAGVKWSSAIQQGLRDAKAMIVIISPASMASTNVEDEWQWFLDRRKPLIPVLLEPADIHFQLSRLQYIDFATQDYDTALTQLKAEIKRLGSTFESGETSGDRRSLPQSVDVSPADDPLESPVRPRRGLQLTVALVVVLSALLFRQLYESSVTRRRPKAP